MRKSRHLTDRIRNSLLARLRRRERRLTYDRAVDLGLLTPRHHTIASSKVTAYAVTPPLSAMAHEELTGLVSRILSSTDTENCVKDLQGPPAPSAVCMDTRQSLGDNRQFRTLIERHIGRAPVGDCALTLLMADAVAATGDAPAVLSRIRQRQFTLLIKLPFIDSAHHLKALIIDGIFGGEPGEREEQRWPGLPDSVTIARFSNRKLVIIDLDKIDTEKEMQLRFERAVRDGHSVALLSSAVEPSAWVRAAVDLLLSVDEMSPETLARLIALQSREEAAACSELVRSHWSGGQGLCLMDLAVAMSPDRTASDMIIRLNALQSYRREAEHREKADRSESGKSGRKKGGSETWIEVIHPEAQSASPSEPAKLPLRVEDLHGYGPAKEWALALRQDLDEWRRGKIGWNDMSTKILLYGPPGTGKTTFARALPNTLTVPLLITSVSAWLEPGYLGDVIKRIRDTFRLAQENAPCVLFVDELDGISKRDGGGDRKFDDYWINVINRLLECLDGALKSEGVVFVGATNRPQAIDPALLRSGRIEEQVEIPLPDLKDLTGILKYHLRQSGSKGPTFAALEVEGAWERLCARLIGASGADVEKLVKLARARTRREGRALELGDLEAMMDLHRPLLGASLAETFAVHEAGHAVAYAALGLAVAGSISIADPAGGRTSLDLRIDQLQFEEGLENTLVALLAGREAERLFVGRIAAGSGGSPNSDLARATSLAIRLEGIYGYGAQMPLLYRYEYDDRLETIHDLAFLACVNQRLEKAEERARQLVRDHAAVLMCLADRLQRKLVIEGEELTEILAPLSPVELRDKEEADQ